VPTCTYALHLHEPVHYPQEQVYKQVRDDTGIGRLLVRRCCGYGCVGEGRVVRKYKLLQSYEQAMERYKYYRFVVVV
jgi:hypothetical protein